MTLVPIFIQYPILYTHRDPIIIFRYIYVIFFHILVISRGNAMYLIHWMLRIGGRYALVII